MTRRIAGSTLEALLVGAATPIGLWLGMQLTDPSSPLRIRLAELADQAQALVDLAREEWIRHEAAQGIRDLELELADTTTTEDTQP